MLRRERNEEARFITIALVKGPVFASGTNYFHVHTDQDPADRNASVVGLTWRELCAPKNKDFIVKKALHLFTPQPHTVKCQ